jgi:N-acetylglucosamine-6-phosphate deacetylase
MRAVAMPGGVYDLGGLKVATLEGKAVLANGTLAGSLLTLNNAIINNMKFTKFPIWEAVRMVSLNPAKRLGLDED